MLVTLPVTPFAKRCLMYEYKVEPVLVSPRSTLFQNLSKRTFSDKHIRASQECKEELTMKVPRKIIPHLMQENNLQLGYMLHKFYINQMLDTVLHTTAMTQVTVMDCVKNYFALRKVTEDDYALESAYKAWQRFQVKYMQKNTQISITKASQAVEGCYTYPKAFVLKKMLLFFDVRQEQMWSHPLNSKLLQKKRKYIMYILYTMSDASYRDIGKLFRINFPAVHKNVKDTEFYYKQRLDENLCKIIDEALDTLFINSPLKRTVFSRLLEHVNNTNQKT